ncbi:hypothetical protein Kisp01_69480 [Kineosporia sp. NBRC 101677]|nr:hypothetical protein Kisp01_69480 [Kineosporia sp. NBRC 101677]
MVAAAQADTVRQGQRRDLLGKLIDGFDTSVGADDGARQPLDLRPHVSLSSGRPALRHHLDHPHRKRLAHC